MTLPIALLVLAACGGTQAPQSPNAGHYSGVLILSSPGRNDDIACSVSFAIPDFPGEGGALTMNCSGTTEPTYKGHAFLIDGYISFDLKATEDRFAPNIGTTDDCEFEGYNPIRPVGLLKGNIIGCGGVIGRYDTVLDANSFTAPRGS